MNPVQQKIESLKSKIENNFTKQLNLAEQLLNLTIMVKNDAVSRTTAETEFKRLKEQHIKLRERVQTYMNELAVLELCVDVCEN